MSSLRKLRGRGVLPCESSDFMSQGDQMPLFFTFEGLDSTDGTTNKGAWYGKEGWMPPLKYEVLSITKQPAFAAFGAYSADIFPPGENNPK